MAHPAVGIDRYENLAGSRLNGRIANPSNVASVLMDDLRPGRPSQFFRTIRAAIDGNDNLDLAAKRLAGGGDRVQTARQELFFIPGGDDD